MPTYLAERAPTRLDLELSRLGPPTRNVQALSDRDVLLAGRRARIAENRANGERLLCFVEFYRRRLATEEQKREASPHFALTARQETVVEIGSLWGMDAARVRKELNVALFLCQDGEEIWQLCLTGQVDGYRASLIADAARQKLDTSDEIAKFMTRMLKFLLKSLTGVDADPDAAPLVTCTVRQLRNKIDYEIRKLQPTREDEQFRRSYEARTAAGFRHPIARTTHPVSDDISWPELEPDGFQFSATELREAISGLRDWYDLVRPRSPEQLWEEDFDEGLTEDEWAAAYA